MPIGIVFASELKALIKHPGLNREIDIHNLSRYLLYEYVPAPHTIFKGVKKVFPGHFLKWKDGEIDLAPYWQIQFNGDAPIRSLSFHDLERQLIYLLKQSIERRLMSDVPLGVFLSGGVDSSAIVALMSELIPPEHIKTFSIGFEENSFDESTYAEAVARRFKTDHHRQTITSSKLIEILPEVWNFLDEPFADASIIPTYLLSKFTQRFVTVALGGDGGDELFAGYDPFLAHIFAEYYEKIPESIHNKVVKPLVQMIPVSTTNMSIDFKLKQFFKGIPYGYLLRNQVWLGAFSTEEQTDFLSQDIACILNGFDPLVDIRAALQEAATRDRIDEMILLYSRFYLGEGILTKVDRASMATSLEVRSPFLDVKFAEFVNNLPSILKLRRLNRKYILKKSFESRLPKDILYRGKKGFGVPLAEWFKKELKEFLLDILSPSRLNRDGIFNPKAIVNLLNDHFNGEKDNRKQIWTLFMFEMWKENFR
ncbi:MAG: asparagine synthase (glutamine-hydrolyzing) [Thermodesulfobacteriota bacterium]|nr:asparagine synthase (glutamine-hydrolyzing) [Thermodesulfobacteriota bacterium]